MASKKRSSRRAVDPRLPQALRDPHLDHLPSDPDAGAPARRVAANDQQPTSNHGAARGKSAERTNRAHADSAVDTHAARCISLTEIVRDQEIELSETFKAFVALERLVSPEYEDEAQAGVPLSRAELGALLRMLNAVMLRQIGALAKTTTALEKQMNEHP